MWQPSAASETGIRATTHLTRLRKHPSELAPVGGLLPLQGIRPRGPTWHGYSWRFALGLGLSGTSVSIRIPTPRLHGCWKRDPRHGRRGESRAAPIVSARVFASLLQQQLLMREYTRPRAVCLSVCPGCALCSAGVRAAPLAGAKCPSQHRLQAPCRWAVVEKCCSVR